MKGSRTATVQSRDRKGASGTAIGHRHGSTLPYGRGSSGKDIMRVPARQSRGLQRRRISIQAITESESAGKPFGSGVGVIGSPGRVGTEAASSASVWHGWLPYDSVGLVLTIPIQGGQTVVTLVPKPFAKKTSFCPKSLCGRHQQLGTRIEWAGNLL